MTHPLLDAEQAKTIAYRFSAALVARRLYSSQNPVLARSMDALYAEMSSVLAMNGVEHVAIGLMTNGLSVAGVPLLVLPEAMEKLGEQMRARGIEIITITRNVRQMELEILCDLLNTPVVQLTAVDVDKWLKDRGASHISVKHLELSEGKVARSMREVYSQGRDLLGKEFGRAVEKGSVELGAMSDLAGTMLDLILRSDVPVSTLIALRGREDYSYTHSMNVSLLASSQAASLGLDEATTRAIGLAALVHDVGKTTIPASVLTKTTPLTASEAEMLHNHATEGARILMRTQGGGGLEAIVAAEHHLPYTADPHLASQLVAIADAFDSIRSLRPFSDRASLRMALRFMLKHMRHRLNPYLLQRFCVMCGMYQPGDVVRLKGGETARVIGVHPELGSRPVIEVTETGRGVAPPGTQADLSLPQFERVRIEKDAAVVALRDLTVAHVDALA